MCSPGPLCSRSSCSFEGWASGTGLAAITPTAQAYIADVTKDEAARVKGMAGVGAVQGVAMIAGAVLGGVLASFGLLLPVAIVPVLLGLGLVLTIVGLRREPRHALIAHPARVRPTDPRVWPFLAAGFGMFTSLGFVQVLTGFVVQDRLALDAETTGLVTGGVLLAAGLGSLVSQAIIVPRSGWGPATLLRIGSATAFVGFLAIIPSAGPWTLVTGILVIGLGLGIAMPGYTAGPTLLMSREEQGGLAGLIGATNGLTFVIAPTASTALYGIWAPLPIVVGALIMLLVAAFVLLHPRFRRLPSEPVTTTSPRREGA